MTYQDAADLRRSVSRVMREFPRRNLRIMNKLFTIAHKFQAKSSMHASVTPALNRTQKQAL
jgi:hypothetical protein